MCLATILHKKLFHLITRLYSIKACEPGLVIGLIGRTDKSCFPFQYPGLKLGETRSVVVGMTALARVVPRPATPRKKRNRSPYKVYKQFVGAMIPTVDFNNKDSLGIYGGAFLHWGITILAVAMSLVRMPYFSTPRFP